MNRPIIHNPEAILELNALLKESVKVDLRTSFLIEHTLVKLGYIPEKCLAWFFLFEQIDNARHGSNAARQWLDQIETAALESSIPYPAPLRAFALEIRREQRKPREKPCAKLNRQIAQTIYQARKMTSLIPCQPYNNPAQIDAIERADNSGLARFFLNDFYPSLYPPFKVLDETTLRRIYKQHRRALIILDLATFAVLRALSAPAK